MSVHGLPMITNAQSVTFQITSSEPLLGGDVGQSGGCALDGVNLWQSCQGEVTLAQLSDGVHVYSVQAVDPAYNVGPVSDLTFTVDTTAPIVAITSAPPSQTTSRSATFEFSAPDLTGVTYMCRLDGPPKAPCTSPITYNSIAPGTHTFYVEATDAAGNVGPFISWIWQITG
jgi:hypothetical protein